MASWWLGRTWCRCAWFLRSFTTLLVSSVASAGGAANECVLASNQALTLQEEGQLIAAREQLLRCVVTACPKVVREDCEQQLSSVRAAIPTVVFQVKDQQGNDLDQVTITLDGKPLAVSVEGTPVELDPGKRQLRFERSGYVPVERTIIVAQSERDRRERVVLARLDGGLVGVAPTSSNDAAGGAGSEPSAAVPGVRVQNGGAHPRGNASAGDSVSAGEPVPTEENGGLKPRGLLATTGLITAGVGVLGFGASGVFALLARSNRNEAQRYTCDASGDCGKGPELWDEGKQQAVMATSLLIGGGLLTATGVSLYFVGNARSTTGEPGVSLTPEVDASGVRLNLGGRF